MVIERENDIKIILDVLGSNIFPNLNAQMLYPKELGIANIELDINFNNSFNFHVYKHNEYLMNITINRDEKENNKIYRDLLVSKLKNENVTYKAGDRMKLSINVKSFLEKFENILTNTKAINKFNL